MNYKLFTIILLSLSLIGCDQSLQSISKKNDIKIEKKYKNLGFALIYNENLDKIKKIDDRSLDIYHKSLKRKSIVKITNPKNNKSLIANVKSNKVIFSDFYNSIISQRIAEMLDLDIEEPYLEIVLVSKVERDTILRSSTHGKCSIGSLARAARIGHDRGSDWQ